MIILLAVVAVITFAAVKLYPQISESSASADLSDYFGVSDGQAALVVNDEILEAKGVVRDDQIYIDYDTVATYFNDRFCWDESTEQMLITLPSGTETFTDGDGSLVLIDGEPWLSADCISENSDIDFAVYSSPDRVVARTEWDNIPTETVTQDSKVRTSGSKKGETLTTVSAGDTVVLTQNDDAWCQVSTEDGFIGYIEKSSLETGDELTHTPDPSFSYSKISLDEKINMGWQYTETDDGISNLATLTNGTGVNVVSPTWFTVTDKKGTVNSLAGSDYVEQAHNSGISVWGCFQDVADDDGVSADDYLQTEDVRQKIISSLIQYATDVGMDGINLDIETVTEENVRYYLQFIRELCQAAHEENLIVSVDNYTSTYTQYLNRAEQAEVADYLVIMGYDEHTAGSEEAGSVASLPFVEQGITDLLDEGVDASQIINGIPFYSRGWTYTSGGGVPTSETLAMGDQQSWADSHGIELSWDSSLGQYTGSVTTDDGTTYSIWIEDDKSIEEKMKLIEKYDLAGVAEWRLGLEDAGVWEVINNHLQ